MKIRYGNGQAAGILVLRHNAASMRVAIRGTDDVLELRHAAGAWVTEDGAVLIDENPRRASHCVREEDCICPAGLAAHLIDLLYTDSPEDVEEAPILARPA